MKIYTTIRLKVQNIFKLHRVLQMIWHSSPGWTLASIALLIAQGILPLLQLYLSKVVVDSTSTAIELSNKYVGFSHLAFILGLAGGVVLVSNLCNSIAGIVNEAHTQVVIDYITDLIHAKSIEVDLEYYENPQYYDILHRAQTGATYRPTRILNSLIQIGQNAISVLAITGLLISFHWWIAIILFVATIPGIFIRLKYADQIYKWERVQTTKHRKAWYLSGLITSDTYAKETRLFNFGEFFRRQFQELQQQIRLEKLAIKIKFYIKQTISQISVIFVVFGSFAFIAYQTIQGSFTLGDLIMYYQAFQRGQDTLQSFLGGFGGLYEDILFLDNLYEFLDLEPRIVELKSPISVPHPLKTGIVFKNLSFKYATSTQLTLENINLTILPGEIVGLVGENGSGKTTLIKLLCRLYNPTSGSITFDDIDISHFEASCFRQEISVIFQDYSKYNLTVRENIWLGNINLSPYHKKITDVAYQTGANKFISNLHNTYETVLGNRFYQGEELSIGQWQKIALSRALLRDSQLIILDEPTSALDAISEYEIFKEIRQLLKGKTTILISHRLSSIKIADRICVLKKGKIIENGTHDELMELNGIYADLFEIQAHNYR